MRNTLAVACAAATLVLVVGCGGAPSGSAQPAGTAGAPSATLPSAPMGGACASFPADAPGASPRPLTPDPVLEAQFPSEINGKPVQDVNSFHWLEYLCRYGTPGAADIAATAAAAASVPILELTYASARVDVAGNPVGIDAFRTPGVDANVIITNFQTMVLVLGGTAEEQAGTMRRETLGGQDAFVWDQPDGDATYLYVDGEYMFGMTMVTEDQAAAVFAALP